MKEKKLAEEGNAPKITQGSRWAALMSLFQCFDEELSDEVGRTVDVL